jgi:hypothetical protein
LLPPSLSPAELILLPSAFDDERFIFELKHDGFRALVYVTQGGCRLMSRRGSAYKSFRPLCDSLSTLNCSVVLDGEIVSLDHNGRPQFYELLRRRGEPVFYAFDCLWHDGKDLRAVPLLERKQILEQIVRAHPAFCSHSTSNRADASCSTSCASEIWKGSWPNARTQHTAWTGSRSEIPTTLNMKGDRGCSRSAHGVQDEECHEDLPPSPLSRFLKQSAPGERWSTYRSLLSGLGS